MSLLIAFRKGGLDTSETLEVRQVDQTPRLGLSFGNEANVRVLATITRAQFEEIGGDASFENGTAADKLGLRLQ
jgi:hypothetical protein